MIKFLVVLSLFTSVILAGRACPARNLCDHVDRISLFDLPTKDRLRLAVRIVAWYPDSDAAYYILEDGIAPHNARWNYGLPAEPGERDAAFVRAEKWLDAARDPGSTHALARTLIVSQLVAHDLRINGVAKGPRKLAGRVSAALDRVDPKHRLYPLAVVARLQVELARFCGVAWDGEVTSEVEYRTSATTCWRKARSAVAGHPRAPLWCDALAAGWAYGSMRTLGLSVKKHGLRITNDYMKTAIEFVNASGTDTRAPADSYACPALLPVDVRARHFAMALTRSTGHFRDAVSMGEWIVSHSDGLTTTLVEAVHEETGWAYYHMENNAKALEHYKQAYVINPDDMDLGGKMSLIEGSFRPVKKAGGDK